MSYLDMSGFDHSYKQTETPGLDIQRRVAEANLTPLVYLLIDRVANLVVFRPKTRTLILLI
jgi:hypothetical protein